MEPVSSTSWARGRDRPRPLRVCPRQRAGDNVVRDAPATRSGLCALSKTQGRPPLRTQDGHRASLRVQHVGRRARDTSSPSLRRSWPADPRTSFLARCQELAPRVGAELGGDSTEGPTPRPATSWDAASHRCPDGPLWSPALAPTCTLATPGVGDLAGSGEERGSCRGAWVWGLRVTGGKREEPASRPCAGRRRPMGAVQPATRQGPHAGDLGSISRGGTRGLAGLLGTLLLAPPTPAVTKHRGSLATARPQQARKIGRAHV